MYIQSNMKSESYSLYVFTYLASKSDYKRDHLISLLNLVNTLFKYVFRIIIKAKV